MITYENMSGKQLPIEKDLRRLINESMGVADNISFEVDNLIDTIWNVISNEPRKKYKNYKNIYWNQFMFHLNISENFDLPVVCRFLYFNNDQDYKELLKNETINKPKYIPERKFVYVNVIVIRNWFNKQKLSGSLQHEIIHGYDELNAEFSDTQKTFSPEREKGREKHRRRNQKHYEQAKQHLNDKNLGIKSVATALYLLNNNEITAFTNGLYKRLYPVFLKKLLTTYDEVLYNDPLYKFYIVLKNFSKIIKNNPDFPLENVTTTFNITRKHAISLCQTALQHVERGISYAVQKAKLDYENEIFRSPNIID